MNESQPPEEQPQQQIPQLDCCTSRREVPNHKSKSDGPKANSQCGESPVSSPAVPITAIVTSAPLPGTPLYPVRLPLPQQVATQVPISIVTVPQTIGQPARNVTQSTSALPLLVEHPSTQAQVVSFPRTSDRTVPTRSSTLSAGQHTGTSSVSFQSMENRPSATESVKDNPQPEECEDVLMEEPQVFEGLLDETLRVFLSRFTERPDGVTNLLHLRTATSVIEKLGYTLEERLPPVERPNTRDLSVFAYLQIADNVPSEYLIPLDLNEFNELMNKVVREQFGFVGRNFKTRHIDFERIRDIARTVVRDPTGLLRGAEPEATEDELYPSSDFSDRSARKERTFSVYRLLDPISQRAMYKDSVPA